jgi:hypothetical protein
MCSNPRALAKDLRRRAQICLMQADQCIIPEARSALLGLAADYCAALEQLERQVTSEKTAGAPGSATKSRPT